MACPDENTLVAFASGSLSMADASLVDEHLDVCPTCFALVAELARTAPEESEPTRLVPIKTELDTKALTIPAKPPASVSVKLPPPLGARSVVQSAPPPPPAPAPAPSPPPTPAPATETVVARVELPQPDPPPPSQIGRHTLLHRIGADAVGVIYVAHDREHDRRVALKLIGTPRNPSDPEERARIVREARMLAGLHHPNVVQVHDAGEIDGQLYVSTELVEGEPLDRWLLRPGKSWLERLGLFLQTARGLAAAHSVGLVHRDFRPAHALVDVEGRVRVTDFGFARGTAGLRDDAPTIVRAPPIDPGSLQSIHQPVTMSGLVYGTPAYMAPEQYEGRGDARLDQYAFGIALYEALYRRRPFDANDPQSLRTLVLSGAAPPIPTTSEVPGWLGAIVLRAVQRDPERRFPDMTALLAAIDLGLERRRKRRIGALVGTAGAAAIVLVAGIAAAVGREPCESAEERLRGVWDASRRAAAAESVHATGLAYADQSWANASLELDARALAWAQLNEQVCTDARERGTHPATVDPRVACLDRRLVELKEIGALLTSATPSVVERAHAIVTDWPPVQACEQAVDQPPAADPELYGAIAKAHALVLARRVSEAAPVVDRVVLGARDRAAQGEGARLLGELELARARPLPASEAFAQAMAAAVASGDSRGLATASIDHARACLELGRFDEGLHSIALGRAAIERIGPQPRLEAESLVVQGALQIGAGRVGAGRDALERALEIAEDDTTRAAALDRLAVAAMTSRNFDAAESALQRALGLRESELGAQHPEVASTLEAWADVVALAGRDAQASELLGRALTIRETMPTDIRLADTLDRLGRAAIRMGRGDDALVAHQRALALRVQAFGGDDASVIASRVDLGRTEVALGHHREAEAELRRAVEIGTRALGAEHASVVAARAELAGVLAAKGAWGPALVEIEQVLAVLRKTHGDRDPRVGVALVRLAEVRSGEGRRDLARAAAESALSILAQAEEPDAIARARRVLAEPDVAPSDPDLVEPDPDPDPDQPPAG